MPLTCLPTICTYDNNSKFSNIFMSAKNFYQKHRLNKINRKQFTQTNKGLIFILTLRRITVHMYIIQHIIQPISGQLFKQIICEISRWTLIVTSAKIVNINGRYRIGVMQIRGKNGKHLKADIRPKMTYFDDHDMCQGDSDD